MMKSNMTKVEYINQLSKQLKKLPKDAREEAMEYFEEYFEDAASDEEAIANLGTPKEAANQIITNLAIQNVDNDNDAEKNVKKGAAAIWIGILAVFAAPIGLPIALAFVIVLVALIITVVAVGFSFVIAGVSLVATGIVGLAGSGYLLFSHPLNGLTNLGIALMGVGVGIIIAYFCVIFCRWFFRRMVIVFGNIAKRGKKNEK
jgi:uncharacterized membrane protein